MARRSPRDASRSAHRRPSHRRSRRSCDSRGLSPWQETVHAVSGSTNRHDHRHKPQSHRVTEALSLLSVSLWFVDLTPRPDDRYHVAVLHPSNQAIPLLLTSRGANGENLHARVTRTTEPEDYETFREDAPPRRRAGARIA